MKNTKETSIAIMKSSGSAYMVSKKGTILLDSPAPALNINDYTLTREDERILFYTKKNSPEGHLKSIADKCLDLTKILDTIPHEEVPVEMNLAIETLYASCQKFKITLKELQPQPEKNDPFKGL